MKWLFKELGIEVKLKSKAVAINEKEVVLNNGSFTADSVIMALGFNANREILDTLKIEETEFETEVFAIGDCIRPRKVIDAVWEAYDLARSI